MGKFGTKNTKEVVTLAKVITVEILKEACKDGFQIADLGAFLKSASFEKAMAPALEGIGEVPSEVTELNWIEGLDVAKHVYSSTMEVIEYLKGCQNPQG